MRRGIYHICQQKCLLIKGVCFFRHINKYSFLGADADLSLSSSCSREGEGGHAGPWSRDGLTTSVAAVLKSPPSRPLSGLFRTQHFSDRKFTFDNFLLLSKHFQRLLRSDYILVYKIYFLHIMAKCIAHI